MDIFYYNEAFNALDGASGHAFGMLNGLKDRETIRSVATFPALDDGQRQPLRRETQARTPGFSMAEQIMRYIKRTVQSKMRCAHISCQLRNVVTDNMFQLARVSLFDNTPLLLSKTMKIPLIAEWNSPYYYEVGKLRSGSMMYLCRRWEQRFLQNSNLIYTVSNKLSQMLSDEYGLPSNKFLAIPNGFDEGIYPKNLELLQKTRREVRAKSGWDDKTVVAFIGSLKVWHGIETLLKITEYFSARDQTLHFVVIGDGEARGSIQNVSRMLSNLEWMGALPPREMAEFLMGCDLGVMPYVPIEDFYFSPLKMYDMIGAGLPSIGYAAGQIGEVYEQYPEVGWGVKRSTPDEYIRLIEQLRSRKDHIEAKKELLLGARWKHTWQHRSNTLIDALRTLIESGRMP